jgi:hypothetical protein
MAVIELFGGARTIVDDEDVSRLRDRRWRLHRSRGKRYAATGTGPSLVLMHHAIIGKPASGHEVDHANGDSLDNRKANLRTCTHQQNIWNTRPYGRASRYKGVSYDGNHGHGLRPWRARIRDAGPQRLIGRFAGEIDAARAYNREAARMYGAFAWLNPLPKGVVA